VVASLSAAVVVVAALGFAGVLGQWQVAVAHEQHAKDERDEAQRQRDEVKALNEKLEATLKELQATQDQLRRTLYAAHMNLANHAWETGGSTECGNCWSNTAPRRGKATSAALSGTISTD
jgi:hypothetical protein